MIATRYLFDKTYPDVAGPWRSLFKSYINLLQLVGTAAELENSACDSLKSIFSYDVRSRCLSRKAIQSSGAVAESCGPLLMQLLKRDPHGPFPMFSDG